MALKAQIDGVIASINVKPGESVKAGQVLFVIRVSDVHNQPQELKAAMTTSKAYYDRLRQTSEQAKDSVAQYTLMKEKLQYEQDRTAYQKAISLERVRAPISGIISDTDLTKGSTVASGTLLAHVIQPTSLQIKYQLPSQLADKVHLGQQVLFFPNAIKHGYPAKVVYIAPLLSTHDYSLTLRANFDSPQSLRPNLFGKVTQTINAHYKTLAIAQALVQTDAQGFYVYAVKHNKVAKHYFQAGQVSKTGLIAVTSGIASNTSIITSDISTLSPGQTVTVKSL